MKINNSIEDFLLLNVGKKIGLALCHGKKHETDQLKEIKEIEAWYTIDLDNNCEPDLIADISNITIFDQFKEKTFDCVIFVYAPISSLKGNYFKIINRVKRLIKKDGYLITTEFPLLFFWIIDEKKVVELTKRISNFVVSLGELSNYANYIKKSHLILDDKDGQTINDFLPLYHYANNHHKEVIDELSYGYTRQIFRNNRNFVIKRNNNILYWY